MPPDPPTGKFSSGRWMHLLTPYCNLCLWKVLDMCPLCNKNPQTPIHIFNACPVALNKGRCNVWHDSVLASLAKMVEKHLLTTASLSVDLHIVSTTLCPNIMLGDDTQRWSRIYLVELSVCFETRMLSQKRKTAILSWCQNQSKLAIVQRQSQLRLGPSWSATLQGQTGKGLYPVPIPDNPAEV